MFTKQDLTRDAFMLNGSFADEGYDWWWHSFTAVNDETGEEKTFFIEFFTCNPELGGSEPVLGQDEYNLLTESTLPMSWSKPAGGEKMPDSCTASSDGEK